MTSRREVLTLLGAIGAAACGSARATQQTAGPTAAPPLPPLALEPLVDLVSGAGLSWLVDVRPRAILASGTLASAVATLAPEEQFLTFALRHGGIDLRQADSVVAAAMDGVWLGLARLPVDPAAVEAAFVARALQIDGRAVEGGITRFWGTVAPESGPASTLDAGAGDEREQVAVFGREAVGLERGRFGPLRIATYFARGKLKRALPALHTDPLAEAAHRLGDAPVRAFAPGPFVGPWAVGLGGLLRASTSVAVGASPGENKALAVRIILTGAWGADAAAAADRLGSAFRVLADDPLGRLAGVDRPVKGPDVKFDPRAVELAVSLDAAALATGLRAATSTSLAEIMAF